MPSDLTSGAQAAALYLEMLAKWGDEAERRLTGQYATLAWEADGTLRLARSAWRAPPLHYAVHRGSPFAASVLRALFAAGILCELDRDRVRDALFFDAAREGANDWYRGISHVPLGSVVRIRPDGTIETRRWYDPHAVTQTEERDPARWLERTQQLVDEAAQVAGARATKPAIALSGGLDSPIAAAALARSWSSDEQILAITARPRVDWDGRLPGGKFGDDARYAREVAARHGLRWVETREGGSELGLDDVFRASQLTTPFMAFGGMMQATWRAAKAQGADWLFDATIGNDTISAGGDWAIAEYFRGGRWGEVMRALQHRRNDRRPGWRKFLSLALLPLLPTNAQSQIRRIFSRVPAEFADHSSMLRRQVVEDSGMTRRARRRANAAGAGSRREMVDFAWAASDAGHADFILALEQVHGIASCDILAYRPLVEHTLALPNEAFLHRGTDRWLARELARGVMSEEQRTTPLYGAHNADWFLYATEQRSASRELIASIGEHHWLGDLLDIPRMQKLLDDWPDRTPVDPERIWPLASGLANAMSLARFVGHVERSNAF